MIPATKRNYRRDYPLEITLEPSTHQDEIGGLDLLSNGGTRWETADRESVLCALEPGKRENKGSQRVGSDVRSSVLRVLFVQRGSVGQG
jgi:hypothetical protein